MLENLDFVCVNFDWIQSKNESYRDTLYKYHDLLRYLPYQLLHKQEVNRFILCLCFWKRANEMKIFGALYVV